MTNINWDSILSAYRNGLSADILQAHTNGEWGVIWTIAPCDPEALERAGRQFSRARTLQLRHIRRAVLHLRHNPEQAVVIATELPARYQCVRDLDSAEEIVLGRYLQDPALAALDVAFAASSEIV